MKKKNGAEKYSLGELIYQLFEESSKMTTRKAEQKVLVSIALKDLLKRKVNTEHPIQVGA